MREKNTIDSFFGPAGSAAGYVLLLAGIAFGFYAPVALLLIPAAIFAGWTKMVTSIDFKGNRVRYAIHYFGVFPSGHWLEVKPGMGTVVKKNNVSWVAYSRSNRVQSAQGSGYLVLLQDASGKILLPLKKFRVLSDAAQYSDEIPGRFQISQCRSSSERPKENHV